MLKAGQTYNYFYIDNEETFQGSSVYIDKVVDGIAIATSDSFGDMGPFLMKFDATTGEGIEDYANTYLKQISATDMVDEITSRVTTMSETDKNILIEKLLLTAATDTLQNIIKSI